MASLYSILNIARGGMAAQSAGIGITGENITGQNTPGYVRRNAQLEAWALGHGVAGGVNFVGTDRTFDRFAYRTLIIEGGALGSARARSGALGASEAILSPGKGVTIADRVADLFSAFNDLSMKADDPTSRMAVVSAAEQVALGFRDAASGLSEQRAQLLIKAQGVASELSENVERIAQLNLKIKQNIQPDSARAELMDQRDELVREVSELMDVTVVHDDDGTITLLSSGSTLVEDGTAASVLVSADAAGNLQVEFAHDGKLTNVTTHVDGGELGGIREARDTDIVALQTDLDQYAADLTGAINTVHTAGFGLDGASGRALFTDQGGGALPPPPGTAYAMAVNPVVVSDPATLATVSNAAMLPGGNDVILALAQLGDAPLASGQTAAQQYGSLAGKVGNMLSSARGEVEMRSSTLAHAEARRESVSGVSLDEEMVNLTRYQRAYEASLRVLTTADEMLAELMQRL